MSRETDESGVPLSPLGLNICNYLTTLKYCSISVHPDVAVQQTQENEFNVHIVRVFSCINALFTEIFK